MAQIVFSISFLYLPHDGVSVGCTQRHSIVSLAHRCFGLSLQTIDHPASQLDCCSMHGVAPLDVMQREFCDISDAR